MQASRNLTGNSASTSALLIKNKHWLRSTNWKGRLAYPCPIVQVGFRSILGKRLSYKYTHTCGESWVSRWEVSLGCSSMFWAKPVSKFEVSAVAPLQSWPQRCSGSSTDIGTQLTRLAKALSYEQIFWFLSKKACNTEGFNLVLLHVDNF